ncbi:DUF5947 family protein [Qaidamihabitans albus]|uniref:DUF5947 family protein n=1 Tax=Qaidamihabitans albus TaxID=2795733 RepID=UPI0018F1BAB8|nr:DUF5947 family protein [Qaidamihabitans albus]
MTGALERVIRRAGARRAEAAEHCDLCSVPVSPAHRHILDTENGELMCACPACWLLFDRDAASNGHYRQVPQRRLRIEPVPTEALGVPVGLAFFVVRDDGTALAHYPSPMGPTRWEVDQEVWRELAERRAELRGLEANVEALLVNTARGRQQHWLVPIDDCFRLVAVVRREWKGLSGGSTVWPEIERFFSELTERR